MNRSLVLFTILVFGLILAGCQKDDLCTIDQPTSPRMVIVFKDAINPTVVKPVVNLQIKEIGSADFVSLDFEGSTLLAAADTIYLPLRNAGQLTSYNFYTDEGGTVNIDNFDFTYNPKEVYVSRACGFKTDYENLALLRNEENPTNYWTAGGAIIDNSITNSNEVHVEIRH